jgi:uncharacterized glyoxalase superfamily protein PhnB
VPEQRVFPMIDYEDSRGAIEFLTRAFGFVEDLSQRFTDDDGTIGHAHLTLDGGGITLGQVGGGYQSPAHHAEVCEHARRWLETPYIVDGVLVYVDDLRAHFERARSQGATILTPIEEDFPGPRYRAADHEGHRWMFMQAD